MKEALCYKSYLTKKWSWKILFILDGFSKNIEDNYLNTLNFGKILKKNGLAVMGNTENEDSHKKKNES